MATIPTLPRGGSDYVRGRRDLAFARRAGVLIGQR